MKSLLVKYLLLLSICAILPSCSRDDNSEAGYCRFQRSELAITEQAGTGSIIVEWSHAEWTISTDENGFLSSFSVTDGGNRDSKGEISRVIFSYAANTGDTQRSQIIYLTNKKTQEKEQLTVVQAASTPLLYTVNPNVSYQGNSMLISQYIE
ncbi:MAG: hypothetical protein LBU44_04760 [Mediterranea sp.]|nr:hypothetical protein [Mediterranea sp.]